MEYNNLNQPYQQTEKIICPQVIEWITVFFNLIFLFLLYGFFGLLAWGIYLAIAIFICNGISKKNYSYYNIGLILSIIMNSILTIINGLLIAYLNSIDIGYSDNVEDAKTLLYVLLIASIIFAWSPCAVLLCYKSRVQDMCNANVGMILIPQQSSNFQGIGNIIPPTGQNINNQGQIYPNPPFINNQDFSYQNTPYSFNQAEYSQNIPIQNNQAIAHQIPPPVKNIDNPNMV